MGAVNWFNLLTAPIPESNRLIAGEPKIVKVMLYAPLMLSPPPPYSEWTVALVKLQFSVNRSVNRLHVGFQKPGSFCKTGFSVLGKAKTGFRFRIRFWKSHNCVHCESAGEG